jgi:hypothetical protein
MRKMPLSSFWMGILIIIGCGVQNSPKEEQSIFIPEKISVAIPNTLKEPTTPISKSSKQSKIEVEPHGGTSEGYQRLTGNTFVIDSIIRDIKFNIVLENRVMPTIQKLCKDVPLNTVCTIPNNEVELNITEILISEYEKFYPRRFNINENIVGKTIPFNAIEFVRYDNNHSYQYALNVNLTQIYNQLFTKDYISDANYKHMIQNVQWSEDNNTVLSTLDTGYEENVSEYPWTLHYKKQPNIEETMHLFHKELVSLQPSMIFNFDLMTKDDQNRTTIFKMNEIQERFSFDSLSYSSLSSYGEVHADKGLERYTLNQYDNVYGNSKYRQDEVFDTNGTNVASTYCSDSEYEECTLYDASTWYIDTNDSSLFEPFNEIGFNELKIIGGNLKEGEYFLMKPDFNLTNPTAQEVLAQNVGSFLVFKEFKQGAIYDKSFIDKLNELPILYAKYNEVLKTPLASREPTLFDKVTDEDAPELSLFP